MGVPLGLVIEPYRRKYLWEKYSDLLTLTHFGRNLVATSIVETNTENGAMPAGTPLRAATTAGTRAGLVAFSRSMPNRPHRRLGPVTFSAFDLTLGRPEETRSLCALFWLFAIAPALTVLLVEGAAAMAYLPVLIPLQLLAAILIGTAAAGSRACGWVTVGLMPLTGLALAWGAISII